MFHAVNASHLCVSCLLSDFYLLAACFDVILEMSSARCNAVSCTACGYHLDTCIVAELLVLYNAQIIHNPCVRLLHAERSINLPVRLHDHWLLWGWIQGHCLNMYPVNSLDHIKVT